MEVIFPHVGLTKVRARYLPDQTTKYVTSRTEHSKDVTSILEIFQISVGYSSLSAVHDKTVIHLMTVVHCWVSGFAPESSRFQSFLTRELKFYPTMTHHWRRTELRVPGRSSALALDLLIKGLL